MSKQAMKLALEALETCTPEDTSTSHVIYAWHDEELVSKAIKALEEALAKQEQGEPVAIIHRNEYNEYRLEPHDDFDIKSIPFNVDVPLFKSPQQRTWVGLTEQEVDECYESIMFHPDIEPTRMGVYLEIEDKLKDKNNA